MGTNTSFKRKMSNSYFDLTWKDAITDLMECYSTEM